ncbi:hypothetical protein ACTOV4_24215, partial [Brucella sp. C7-11G]
ERRRIGRTASEGPQHQRRTAAAELVGSRGMAACGQGKKVGGAVAGQGRFGARPAPKRGPMGGLRAVSRERCGWSVSPHPHD